QAAYIVEYTVEVEGDLVLGAAPAGGWEVVTVVSEWADGVIEVERQDGWTTEYELTGSTYKLVPVVSSGNVVIGGAGADDIFLSAGDDFALGDYGYLDFEHETSELKSTLELVYTTDSGHGGMDTVDAAGGDDVIFGGASGDTAIGGAGKNILFGDFGAVALSGGLVSRATTSDEGAGGSDVISAIGSATRNIVVGGFGDDDIDLGEGDDVVIGDFGSLFFDVDGTSGEEVLRKAWTKQLTGSDPTGLSSAEDDAFAAVTAGGIDTVHAEGGADVMIGGASGDRLYAGDGRDLVLGDFGVAIFSVSGLISAETTEEDLAVADDGDHIYGGDKIDTVFGGHGADSVHGDSGDDILFGDFGRLTWVEETDPATAESSHWDYLTTDHSSASNGQDTIYGGDGEDLAFGGGGRDTIYGDDGRDVLLGDFGEAALLPSDKWTVISTEVSPGD
ncbi:MAG: calcium-binding protein, partial [Myxococcota bacterium]|nr:calcium-binding protein [Myxococcota bacterium]